MRDVERFMDDVTAGMRARLALLDDDGDRRALEDGIALLTDYRLSGMDEAAFERLLKTLRSGRSPVPLAVAQPEAIADELGALWSHAATEGESR